MIGQRLLHYEITEKLGEGGMGVVYKARDTHLDRFVAIKVLPSERMADASRKARFDQEAKAASALNHPNIVVVYDISSDSGVDFIAMEYVAGRTLDQLIPRKGMRLNEALKIAIQVADALARAHGAGIIHRDLKPANVMVDPHGQVKVLDFGLAKLTERGIPQDDSTATVGVKTDEGAVVGTAAYMSPEQAEGKPVDSRADIFSFGALLYEMVTGQRAFQGSSKLSTLSAVLHKEPAPFPAEVPHDLQKLLTRCLRKDLAHRFQHMDDLKVALEELRDDSGSGRIAGVQPAPSWSLRRWRTWAAFAVLLLIAAAGAFFYARGVLKPDAALNVVQLTSYPGVQSTPSFSPDGSQVAFSWNGEKQDNFDIYVKLLSGGPPLRLTTDPLPDSSPAWSPDGSHIAFVRGGYIFLISPLGGPERKLTQAIGSLAWSPDGKSLAFSDRDSDTSPRAIYLVSIATGERRKLTSPKAGSFGGDYACAFSSDGTGLAFTRMLSVLLNEIYILPLANYSPSGEAWRLTDDKCYVAGMAWMPADREVVFSSNRGGRRSLWRTLVSSGAKPRRVSGTEDGTLLAISRGAPPRLVYQRSTFQTNIWSMEIAPPGRVANPPVRIIASTQTQDDPQFSPDGKRIAFTSRRSGNPEIWVANSDGSNPVQLTAFAGARTAGAPRWSPDGRRIAFDSGTGGSFDIYVIDVEGGAPRLLTDGASYYIRPSWSQDGRWIYFGSDSLGARQIWKMPAEGGQAVRVTRGEGLEAFESPDGKTLYFAKGWNTPGIMSVPVAGGAESLTIESGRISHWAISEQGIWFLDYSARVGSGPVPLKLYSFKGGQVSQISSIEKIRFAAEASLSITRDGRQVAWRQIDRDESDLMLVENFR